MELARSEGAELLEQLEYFALLLRDQLGLVEGGGHEQRRVCQGPYGGCDGPEHA